MKKVLLLLILIIFATGCTFNDNNLDILKEYIENTQYFNCKSTTCVKEEKIAEETTKSEYNFNKKTYTKETKTSLSTIKCIYN